MAKTRANIHLATLVACSVMVAVYQGFAYSYGVPPADVFAIWWPIVFVVLLVLWVEEDSKSYPQIYKPFEYGFLLFILWLPYLPYYLWRTRRAPGLLLLAGFVLLYMLGFLVVLAIHAVDCPIAPSGAYHALSDTCFRPQMSSIEPMKPQILLRVVVIDPPPGVVFALQRGRDDLVAPVHASAASIVFEFPVSVAVAASRPPRLAGEFAQGPPGGRFVYINSGTMAGQADSCWTRRAKVPLAGISRELLHSARTQAGQVLEARISGTADDGGPACATVPLLSGWTATAP